MPRRIGIRVIAALCAAMLWAAVLLATGATTSRAQSTIAPDQRKAIEEVIRGYLLDNPEVLVEALDSLRRRRDDATTAAAQKAIREGRGDLLRDPGSPVSGRADGDVMMVEFFDYRCGVCRRVHRIIAKLLGTDDKIRRVYKEWPILGPNSVFAARAALASRRQGKYFAFHDALMEFPGKLTNDEVIDQARKLGIDVARLKQDMQDPEISAILRRNLELANALKLRGTPSFVIGDELVRGGRDLDTLRQLIARARQRG